MEKYLQIDRWKYFEDSKKFTDELFQKFQTKPNEPHNITNEIKKNIKITAIKTFSTSSVDPVQDCYRRGTEEFR